MLDAINLQNKKITLTIKMYKNMQTNNTSTAIVVWGSNLGLTAGWTMYSKVLRNMISLPNYQYSVAIGLLLSDGWLQLSSTRAKLPHISKLNARLGFGQSYAKFDYLMHVYFIMGHYCSNFPIFMQMKLKGQIHLSLRFFTRSLPCFTQLFNKFYTNKIKLVPTDIYNLLDPVALAHWIMGDGAKSGNGLLLCTDSFILTDIIMLMNVLTIRYNLICSLHKSGSNQYRIYVSSKSKKRLHDIVSSHIVPSMLYKLGI